MGPEASIFFFNFPFFLAVSPGEKPGPTDRKGGLGMPSRDRTVGTPGQDNPGVSLHPLSVDNPDHREPGEHFRVRTGMAPAPQLSLRWKPLSPLGISPLFVASFSSSWSGVVIFPYLSLPFPQLSSWVLTSVPACVSSLQTRFLVLLFGGFSALGIETFPLLLLGKPSATEPQP